MTIFAAVFFIAGIIGMALTPDVRAGLMFLGLMALAVLYAKALRALLRGLDPNLHGDADHTRSGTVMPRPRQPGQNQSLGQEPMGWHLRFVVVAVIIVSVMMLIGAP